MVNAELCITSYWCGLGDVMVVIATNVFIALEHSGIPPAVPGPLSP